MAGLIWCLIGLATLVAGSELLVRQGTKLVILAGIPPIVIGLTVVAVGTSAPELAIGIEAALLGKGSLAVGNVAGTNILNILLILGLSAWLLPMPIDMRVLRHDLPAMVVAATILVVMAADGVLTRFEGMVLVLGAIAYTIGTILSTRRERPRVKAEFEREFAEETAAARVRDMSGIVVSFLLLAVSIAVVVKGADWLVYGASDLARSLGVSDAFIGLTVVAIGTSSPELVTMIVATLRGERDIAIGNVIGSSTYKILAILGTTALVPGNGIAVEPDLIRIDIPISALAALACIPIFLTSRRVTRIEGALFVCAYLAYLTYLVIVRG